MSYIDQEQPSRRVAIGGVVLLHVAIGYALISGLAINVIRYADPPIEIGEFKEAPPPPPLPPPLPEHKAPQEPTTIDTIVKVDTGPVVGLTETPPEYPRFTETPPPQPPQPPLSHARGALPGPGRATWVTTDDYPGAALRDEVQGVVGIDVAIGTDGRVTACSVTGSSGSDLLDQATCRLYARRARFQAALDDDGKATVGHFADRIRWTIPQ